MASMVSCFHARTHSKIGKFTRDYAAKNIAFVPAILSVAGKIHPEFLRLLWVMADMQTIKYFNLVGDDDDIRSERFKWSRASAFSYNRNVIGLAIAYASAIRTHLSVHGAAHLMLLLFALSRRLILSSAALLTPLILVNRKILVQARWLPVVLSVATLSSLGAGEDGGGGNHSLSPRTTTGAVPGSVACASVNDSWSLPANKKSSIVSQGLSRSLGLSSLLLL